MEDVYALCHLETGAFLCARRDDEDYIICFTARSDAEAFRDALGARDHCGVVGQPIHFYPTGRLYLDERLIDFGTTANSPKSPMAC
jgi:hypothetical protein